VAEEYFPTEVVARYGHLISDHPLRRELIATSVANGVVNAAGITLVTRLMTETGAAAEQVVRAYHIARAVTDAPANWEAVEALVAHLPVELERTLLSGIDVLVESVTRWYLTNPGTDRMGEVIANAEPVFEELAATIAEYGPSQWRSERDAAVAEWTERGVPSAMAHRHVYQEELVHAPDIIEVIRTTGRTVREVAEMFFLAGAAFEIDWLETHMGSLTEGSRWQRRAAQTVEDDLVVLRRQLVEGIFAEADGGDVQEALQSYLVARTHELGRLTRFMRSLAADGVTDVAQVIVAIRQIRNLAT
jgi:glutamate dehydrogenase